MTEVATLAGRTTSAVVVTGCVVRYSFSERIQTLVHSLPADRERYEVPGDSTGTRNASDRRQPALRALIAPESI